MIYEYKCDAGHVLQFDRDQKDRNMYVGYPCGPVSGPYGTCPLGLRRKYTVSFAPVMQSHFNSTVGKPISDMNQFRDELKRSSDAATERTGIVHDFQPIDPESAKAPETA